MRISGTMEIYDNFVYGNCIALGLCNLYLCDITTTQEQGIFDEALYVFREYLEKELPEKNIEISTTYDNITSKICRLIITTTNKEK